ncbi:universal stress protein [Sphingomonas sp. So64.6b]|uniref:universal stress protein n=1 Tax=Sphingomonas sp. So64.6b TaxID=2997354 RepID=UPI001601E80E|nr:universal stress protein [Sphingomonas sp. So64.6b]
MTYSTLMVHLDAGHPNMATLSLAAKLAERYRAKVIGVAVCQPMEIGTSDGYFTGELVTLERDIVDQELKRAETEFRDCTEIQPFILEWRSIPTMGCIAEIVASEARCADLIITSAGSGPQRNPLTHADTGELIIRAGRPVLVVPDGPAPAIFETVIIAWSNTRECRRAITDALPILEQADRVLIVEVTPKLVEARSQINDVVAWLSRHMVSADTIVGDSYGDSVGTLALIAKDHCADLIVAGAYGHNRLREWAFGGVTRDLLLRNNRCALLSH